MSATVMHSFALVVRPTGPICGPVLLGVHDRESQLGERVARLLEMGVLREFERALLLQREQWAAGEPNGYCHSLAFEFLYGLTAVLRSDAFSSSNDHWSWCAGVADVGGHSWVRFCDEVLDWTRLPETDSEVLCVSTAAQHAVERGVRHYDRADLPTFAKWIRGDRPRLFRHNRSIDAWAYDLRSVIHQEAGR